MLRTPPILLLILVLMACTISAQAQTFTLDKCLDDLAEKQSLGPVVAVMHGPVEGTADLSSLEGLAKTFGLKLFDQDGIHVLGPEMCIALYDLSEYFPKERPKPTPRPEEELFQSLTQEQMKAVGSRDGLHFADLSGKQQEIAARIFTGTVKLHKRIGGPPSADDFTPPPSTLVDGGEAPPSLIAPDPNVEVIGLSNLPIEEMSITGWTSYGTSLFKASENDECYCSVLEPDVPMWDPAEHDLHVDQGSESPVSKAPEPLGPNVLKASQLDYERVELQKQAEFPERTNLRDVVAIAAEESGLPLFIGPGSEQVLLYVKAGGQSVGQVLKAASLATGGTWRKVGDLFVYTLDLTGSGSFQRRIDDLARFSSPLSLYEIPFDALKVRGVMLSLPVIPGTTFSLTPQQIMNLTAEMAENPSPKACRLPLHALTPQQQAAVLKQCPAMKDVRIDDISIGITLYAGLSFHFPAVGNANSGFVPARHLYPFYLLPPPSSESYLSPEFDPRAWPKGYKIPMPSGTRGILCRVARSDTPATMVASMARYGFDTLLIRVFSDGYTIFPSKQFPQLPRLKTEDFLRNVIAVAHSRGIRVIGVIDALRWSDGDRKHWLYKTPEVIDRDITGRMNTQWLAERTLSPEEAIQERNNYGDAFDGDFVTPFHPLVRQKLSALVGELATYDLDGLAFDHTSILYPAPSDYETNYPSGGQTGYHDLARSAFVRGLGTDPIDIAYPGAAAHVVPTPLAPISDGAASQKGIWAAFYRTACDALLDILIEDCRKAKPHASVWVIDTYRDDLMMEEPVESHTWSEFEGRLSTVVGQSAVDVPNYAGKDIKAVQLVRITDVTDLLLIASRIAIIQGRSIPGIIDEHDLTPPSMTPIEDIVFDFACSETRKAEFLKLLETARPAKTR